MIEASHLTKRYGLILAVDDLSFTVPAGQVTGFLGPNESGKSTTMRMIVGLDTPSGGRVTVAGRSYGRLRFPLREVGALLNAGGRVDEVLDVGLAGAAQRRAGLRELSLGMGQRLGIAAALLGDPAVLIFDEPINGLDPERILWVRNLLLSLAAEGRTVLVPAISCPRSPGPPTTSSSDGGACSPRGPWPSSSNAAKVATFGAVVAVVSLISCFAAFWICQALLVPTAGFIVVCAYTAATVMLAAFTLDRRDA